MRIGNTALFHASNIFLLLEISEYYHVHIVKDWVSHRNIGQNKSCHYLKAQSLRSIEITIQLLFHVVEFTVHYKKCRNIIAIKKNDPELGTSP